MPKYIEKCGDLVGTTNEKGKIGLLDWTEMSKKVSHQNQISEHVRYAREKHSFHSKSSSGGSAFGKNQLF